MPIASNRLNKQLNGYRFWGLAAVLTISLVFYFWSAKAQLNAAAIAPGVIAVETNRKSIEHLEGGVVQDIYVKEGETVVKGQPLLRLSDIAAKGNFNQIKGRLINEIAQRDRLQSERLGLEKPRFSDLIADAMLTDIEVVNLVERQTSLFNSRRKLHESELLVLEARLNRVYGEKETVENKLEQQNHAFQLLKQEQSMHDRLIRDGYSSKLRSIELQRSGAMLLSDLATLRGSLDNLDLAVAEINEQKANIVHRFNTELDKEYQDHAKAVNELSEELEKAKDVLQRVEIKSPRDGKILGLNVYSEGQVIQRAEKLLEVVPVDDLLIVEAFLNPNDIDDVRKDLEVFIRLGSYNFRTTPLLPGRILNIAADRVPDKENKNANTGYRIKVEIDRDSLAEHTQLALYPGMPAEVYITLKKRTLMDYLLEPLSLGILKAFRES